MAQTVVELTGITFRRGGTEPDRSAWKAAVVYDRVQLVREAAGDRYERLELNALLQRVIVTDDRRKAAEELTRCSTRLSVEDRLPHLWMLQVGLGAEWDEIIFGPCPNGVARTRSTVTQGPVGYAFEAPSPATRGPGTLERAPWGPGPTGRSRALRGRAGEPFRCCDCGPRADCSLSSISDGLLHSFDRARRATSPAPRSPRSRRRTLRPWACGTSFLFAAPADLGTYGPCRCRQGPQGLDPRARI